MNMKIRMTARAVEALKFCIGFSILACLLVTIGMLAIIKLHPERQNSMPWGVPIFFCLAFVISMLIEKKRRAAEEEHEQLFNRAVPKTADQFAVIQPNVNYHLKAQAERYRKVCEAKVTFMNEIEKINLSDDAETDANLSKLIEYDEAIANEKDIFIRKHRSAKRVGFVVCKDELAYLTLR
jgi:hypothetical protein